MRYQPREHQLRIAKRLEAGSLLLSASAGSGKTGSCALPIGDLLNAGINDPILVIAPFAVLEHGWKNELPLFGVDEPITSLAGLTPAKREKILKRGDFKILGITWSLLDWFAKYCAANDLNFEVLVGDESSAIKNATTKTAQALIALAKRSKKTWLLSATPSPNGVRDLWAQMTAITRGEAFWGSNFYSWQSKHFINDRKLKYRWYARPGATQLIQNEASKHTLSLRLRDCVDIPQEVHSDFVFDLSAKERKVYDTFRDTGLIELDGQKILVKEDLPRLQRFYQLTSGFVYSNENKPLHVGDSKLENFEQIYREQGGRPVMVAINYRHDLELLRKIEPKIQAITGATPMKDRPKIIEAWNNDSIKLLALSPQAAAHGLNLQKGSCEMLIWWTLTWSSEYYVQMVARLVRTGQEKKINVLRMVADKTIDQFIVDALLNKTLSQQKLLDATRLIK